MNQTAFDELRTKEMLGYIVKTSVSCIGGKLGIYIVLQGEMDARFLEERISVFVSTALKKQMQVSSNSDNISEHENKFEHNKKAMISRFSMGDGNMSEESVFIFLIKSKRKPYLHNVQK